MKKRISFIISLMMIISLVTMHTAHAETLYETNWEAPREHMIMVGVTGDRYAGYKERIIHKLNMLRYTACREHECDPNTNLYPNKNYRYHLKDDYGPNPTDQQLSEKNEDYWPMTWSGVCEQAAEIRASELALRYGHTRPSGDDFSMNFDGVDKNKNNTCAECLYNTTRIYNDPCALFEKAIDKFAQEREAYDAYINGNTSKTTADFGHYAICINPANVHVGMSALAIAQGDKDQNYQGVYKSFVSLEAGYAIQETSTKERNNSGRMTQKVEVRENYVDAIKGPDDMTIDDDVAHPVFIYVGMKRIDDPDHDPKLSYWKVYDGLSSTSSNENVAKMDEKGVVHPRGAGKATITVNLNGHSCSFQVTVSKAHQHHYQEQVIKAATCENDGEKKLTCAECGDEKNETIPALGHKYGAWTSLDDQQHQRICENDKTHVEKEVHDFDGGVITKAATYQEEGMKTYTCRKCGFTKTESIPTLTHVHNYQVTSTKEATCDDKGTKTYTCTICGEIKTETIPALGHDYGNWQKFNDLVHERICKNDHNHVDKQSHRYDEGKVLVSPTCAQTGVMLYTCQDCGYTKRESMPTIDHDYDNGKIVVAPTCVAKGVKVYTCKTCGQTKSEELDYDSHNHPNDQIMVVNQKDATATSEGYTGDRKCMACGQIIKKGTTIPKTNHTHVWNQGVITKEASCSEAGVKTYTCANCGETKTETIPTLGHDYGEWKKYDDLIHKRVCKRDAHHVDIQPHRYDQGQTVITPTCARVGEKIYICQDCGYMKRENLSILDHHDYDDGKIVEAPTCSSKGVKVYTCNNCGETRSEELDYDAHNHPEKSQVIKNKKEASVTEDGYSGDLVCNGCGQILKKGTVISKTGHAHSWNDGEITKEPSCTQAGEKVYTCSVCLETKAESIPALGHDYDDGKITITPTCTKKGKKVYRCKRCGDEKTEELPMDQCNHPLDHLSVQNKKEATITEDGYSGDVICVDCGAIVKAGTVIPKLISKDTGTVSHNNESANTDNAKKTSDEKTNQIAGSESDQTNTNAGHKQEETVTLVNKETPQQSNTSSYNANVTNDKQTAGLQKNEQVLTNVIQLS